MSAPRPVTLITGASSGIGLELARVFAANGHDLVLVARRRERLEQLAAELGTAFGKTPVVMTADLQAPGAVAALAAALAHRHLEVQFLVNNAGFGLAGDSDRLDRAEQLAMIDLNVRVLAELSLAFIGSQERHNGGLLNVASVAAFLPGPRMAVYYASKAFVLSFTEALHAELKPRGVRVTVLCPGPVATEFQQRAGVASGPSVSLLSQPADRVALEGYEGLMQGRRRIVPGPGNRIVTALLPFVPRALLFRILAHRNRGRRSPGAA